MDENNQELLGEETPEAPEEPTVPKKEFDKVFARAKQGEEAEKKLKEELAIAKKAQPIASSEELTAVKADLALLKYMQKGYSEDEAKLLLKTGDDPTVLAGIESMRSKAKVEQGTPPPSPRISTETPQTKSYADLPKEERKKFVRDLHWQKLAERQRKVRAE